MSDKRNEDLKQFIIPENFMGESRLFQGQLKTRNVVEGGLISGVLAIFFGMSFQFLSPQKYPWSYFFPHHLVCLACLA